MDNTTTKHEQVEADLGHGKTLVDVKLKKIIEILNQNGFETFCSCQDDEGEAYINFHDITPCKNFLDRCLDYCRENNKCASCESLQLSYPIMCRNKNCQPSEKFLWNVLTKNDRVKWTVFRPRDIGTQGREITKFETSLTFPTEMIQEFEDLLIREFDHKKNSWLVILSFFSFTLTLTYIFITFFPSPPF